jgi:DNA-binding beta-propeller fold protein YncE
MKRALWSLVALPLLLVSSRAEPQNSTDTKEIMYGLALGGNTPAILYQIDRTSGRASQPRDTGLVWITGIAFDRHGVLYTVTTYDGQPPNSLIRIDPDTGQTTVVGATGLSTIFEGDIAFDPTTGDLYGMYDTHPATNMFRIDTTTGAATMVATFPSGFAADISGMVFDPSGQLYLIEDERDQVIRVDWRNATVLSTTPLSSPLGYTVGITYDPHQERFYVADGHVDGTNSLYTIDLTTGRLSLIGGLVDAPEGLAGLAVMP